MFGELEVREPHFGEVVYPPGGVLGPRIQKHLQLVIVYRGDARITVAGIPHYLPAHHVALLWPGERESFRFAEHLSTYHSWCSFTAGPTAPLPRGELPFCLPLPRRLDEFVRTGLSVGRDASPYTQALLATLAKAALLEFAIAAQAKTPVATVPPPLARAKRHIETHYQGALELSDLAALAHQTPTHLIRLFREYYKTTPIRYLWRVRTEQGATLLRESGLDVGAVAYRCGFKTPAHFSRLIKQRYGLSPTALREAYWANASGEESAA